MQKGEKPGISPNEAFTGTVPPFRFSQKKKITNVQNYLFLSFPLMQMYVIRLNPFHTNVGACLFTWNEHGRVLTKGPFDFRVVETPRTAPEAYSSYQVGVVMDMV